jgi:magnesium-transporting ATPase (P-type)
MFWYRIDIPEVFKRLETSESGLSEAEVARRLKVYGPNRLPEGKGVSRLAILLHQFTSPLIYILLIAGVVTALLGEYIDTGVIIVVLILNALIGFVQEYKAETSVRALKKMLVARCRVVRDGNEMEIDAESLVPGDVVVLMSGLKIPADLRLFQALELRTDEAALTGESVPVEKIVRGIDEDSLTPGDQLNMAFTGTACVNGRGRGIVVAAGQDTVLGKIARDVSELSITATPLQEKITRFAKFIGVLVLGSAAATAGLGLAMGIPLAEVFLIAVAASVATVPEGLPIVVTITMAIGIRRMVSRHAIIRKLPAVETLGSTTVICSDKTGTLTKNEMTVKVLYNGEHAYEVTGSGYAPEGKILRDWQPIEPPEIVSVETLLRIGMLCNESDLLPEDGRYKVQGDPTEAALLVSAMKAGMDPAKERAKYRQIGIVPFESDRGWMATLHQADGKLLLFAKGAPERLAEMCCPSDEALPLKARVSETAELFARDGMRVLAMAYREAPELKGRQLRETDVRQLIFAGLQGMIDPPREEALEAVQGCKRAGIRVVMVTGDHPTTAAAIGAMLGLGDGKNVIAGKDLEKIDDDRLLHLLPETSIFARVSPHQKLRIVQQFMRSGEIVAVTGDGVNDAPALKAAHIGVAMGRTGTDVAREASDMVVTDDNFASIFHAVEEGRVVFDNIRKVTLFLIPTGFAAILSIMMAILLGLPIPYVPAQLLWINVVTNGLQDVALAFEPKEQGVIDRPPRHPREGIMSRLMFERSLLVGIVISVGVTYLFVSALGEGMEVDRARTIAMTTMVLFQFFQAWNSRSELQSVFRLNPLSNPFLFYSMMAAALAQISVIYVPALQWVFRTEALNLGEWVVIGLVAASVIVAVEVDKAIRRGRARVPAQA